MSLKYIRAHYRVPAKRGGRVEYTGDRGRYRNGKITGARGGSLLIRLDGEERPSVFHPTWKIRYLQEPDQ